MYLHNRTIDLNDHQDQTPYNKGPVNRSCIRGEWPSEIAIIRHRMKQLQRKIIPFDIYT